MIGIIGWISANLRFGRDIGIDGNGFPSDGVTGDKVLGESDIGHGYTR